MLTFMKFTLFLIFQIIWSPISLIGLIAGYVIETRQSKHYGVSFSAGQALQYRWMMHMFGTRDDPDTIAFTKAFPCESHICLWMVLAPVILSYRYFGLKTSLSKLVEPGYETLNKIAGNRVLAFDRIMEKYLPQVDQVVIPGAGFDLLSQRYTQDTNVKVFELDQTKTTEMKVATLKKASIPHDWITYIPVDYSTESWSKKLVQAGFDQSKKTLFIWQTVSMYLDESLVKETIQSMRDLSAPGSIIAQDFYALAFLNGEISKTAGKNIEMIGKQGEQWAFGLDLSEHSRQIVQNYLKQLDLEVSSYYQFGEKLGLEPTYIIVESRIR